MKEASVTNLNELNELKTQLILLYAKLEATSQHKRPTYNITNIIENEIEVYYQKYVTFYNDDFLLNLATFHTPLDELNTKEQIVDFEQKLYTFLMDAEYKVKMYKNNINEHIAELQVLINKIMGKETLKETEKLKPLYIFFLEIFNTFTDYKQALNKIYMSKIDYYKSRLNIVYETKLNTTLTVLYTSLKDTDRTEQWKSVLVIDISSMEQCEEGTPDLNAAIIYLSTPKNILEFDRETEQDACKKEIGIKLQEFLTSTILDNLLISETKIDFYEAINKYPKTTTHTPTLDAIVKHISGDININKQELKFLNSDYIKVDVAERINYYIKYMLDISESSTSTSNEITLTKDIFKLKNKGATCYINSFLQFIVSHPIIQRLLSMDIDSYYSDYSVIINSEIDVTIESIKTLINLLNAIPENLDNIIKSLTIWGEGTPTIDFFKPNAEYYNRQQPVSEILGKVYDFLLFTHITECQILVENTFTSVEKNLSNGKPWVSTNKVMENILIIKVNEYLDSNINNSNKSLNMSDLINLHIDPDKNKEQKIYKKFDQSNNSQTGELNSTKHMTYILPQYLTIRIERSASTADKGYLMTKNEIEDFGNIKIKNDGRYTNYILQSVILWKNGRINDKGLISGHFITYKVSGDKIYKLDDDKITSFERWDIPEEIKGEGFIFLYIQINTEKISDINTIKNNMNKLGPMPRNIESWELNVSDNKVWTMPEALEKKEVVTKQLLAKGRTFIPKKDPTERNWDALLRSTLSAIEKKGGEALLSG